MDRATRKKLGICLDCHEPAQADRQRCPKHLAQSVLASKRYIDSELGQAYRAAGKADGRFNRYARTTRRGQRGRFTYVRCAAIRKGFEWTLTREQYQALTALGCHYCELPTGVAAGVGLDRLDNARGYSIDNVVSCCTECNIARGDRFTVDEMQNVLGPAIRKVKLARDGVLCTKRSSEA